MDNETLTQFRINKFIKLFTVVTISLAASACNWFDGNDKRDDMPVAPNQAPIVTSLNLSTETEVPINAQLPANDPDGDTLTFAITTMPQLGELSINADGSYIYTPFPEVTGSDSFAFSANDGQAAPVSGIIGITIMPLELSFLDFSRESFARDPSATPNAINGRVFIQDATNQQDYQDLIDTN